MWPQPTKLAEVLENAACNRFPRGWLYLPKDWRTWNADTPAYVIGGDADFDFDRFDREAAERGYAETVDDHLLENVILGVRDLLKVHSFEARLEALIYFVRFDAILPNIGALDPPPWQETQRARDRQFCDSLGTERTDVPCRSSGCERGAVKLSVLCKVHHFEQVHGRPCPFDE